MLGFRVVIKSVERLKLFFFKANQYENSVLTNTNYIRELQQKTFVTLSRVFE